MRFYADVAEFRPLAERVYRRAPVAHTVELTVLNGALPDDSLLLTVWNAGRLIGAALQTPPYPLSCNGIPDDAVQAVAAAAARKRPLLDAVRGDPGTAYAFADAWHAVTGRAGAVVLEERLYRLGSLQTPTVPGAARPAGDDDHPVLVDWVEGFLVEALGHRRDGPAGAAFLTDAGAKGDEFVLWEDDGAPVSMAMRRSPAAGVSRIGPVFTPEDRRGRGYGSAVTAAAARSALDGGADDVVLFADLANPTSNAIYQRIGFRPVADAVRIEFRTLD